MHRLLFFKSTESSGEQPPAVDASDEMSALEEARARARMKARQAKLDEEARVRAAKDRTPTLLDDFVTRVNGVLPSFPDTADLFGGDGGGAGAMTYEEVMRAAPSRAAARAAGDLDDEETDSDSGDEARAEADHRRGLETRHSAGIERLDASACTYEEALTRAHEAHEAATRVPGSPVSARRGGFGVDAPNAPVIVPAPSATDAQDLDSDGDDAPDDYLIATNSERDEQDWSLSRLNGGEVLPPQRATQTPYELVLESDSAAFEILDQRYSPAPDPRHCQPAPAPAASAP